LAEAGVEIPETFDFKGILKLVLSVIGVTWQAIRAMIVKRIGEPVMAKLEKAVDFVKVLVTEGPAGLWKWIVEKIGDLKAMVMDQIKDFVITKVIMAGVTWLIGLLNPAAAFIKACKAIYDLVMFFIEKGEAIKGVIDAALDSVEEILAGGVSKVAGMIENALAKVVPVLIGLLASLLGLGGLGDKIKKILETVRKPVNKAIDFVVGKVVKLGKGVLRRVKNSKLGKAAARAKAKVKAGIAKGKAYVKAKATAAKKWVKGKIGGDPSQVKQKALSLARTRLAGSASFEEVSSRLHGVQNELGPLGLRSIGASLGGDGQTVTLRAVASPAETTRHSNRHSQARGFIRTQVDRPTWLRRLLSMDRS
jgi:hypothetical protein